MYGIGQHFAVETVRQSYLILALIEIALLLSIDLYHGKNKDLFLKEHLQLIHFLKRPFIFYGHLNSWKKKVFEQ